ncbi:LSU ribosomal protein L15P [Neolewinella xylanilytica]|uniref:Large ribosomal subunit protein uL15 n=1 Tax=Neolewinella xylanilytica TaxID=1514080 RepID=A0A2S6I2H1_9BACT|nr:50S ribosomal protein L15 [Neolewinella xylanilytica]PPK85382.1 LSU ribosomal protein L15P [Neolewinella xylanilytica]
MELNNLKPAEGSTKSEKRIARGQGSGRGGTSTRGHKGAKSRSGYKSKRNFEGGQMPLQMRLPKRGFNSPNRVEYVALNLEKLQALSEKHSLSEITPVTLYDLGVVKKNDRIKVLGNGEVSTALTVTAHAASASAKEAIEKAGGSLTIA